MQLNNKTEMKQRNGAGIKVFYNANVVFLPLSCINITKNNNEENTVVALPDGVRAISDIAVLIPIMDQGWRPTNRIAYFNFPSGGANPSTRLSVDTTSVSNVVVIGTYAFPRSYFNIT